MATGYASTTNSPNCVLSYQLIDSSGNTYSSTSSPIKIDSTGAVYITQNSEFTLNLEIVVTSNYSVSPS